MTALAIRRSVDLTDVETSLVELVKAESPVLVDPLEIRATVSNWLHVREAPVLGGGKLNSLLETALPRVLRQLQARESDLSHALRSVPFPQPRNPKFRFVDLFAGIGGFRIALQDVGGRSVFSSEWDRAAKKTYARNFGEHPFGDIKKFTNESVTTRQLARMIPDHDVLAAGFPCQPFSRAGVSARRFLGVNDGFACQTQGTLFFDIIRIAEAKKPRVLFLENVKNLLAHDGGRTFRLIRESIQEIGYSFAYAVLDSSAVVPQRRQRCYMVCVRKGKTDFEFPTEALAGPPLPLRGALEENVDPRFTISDRLWEGHVRRTKRNLDRGTGFTAFVADLDKPAKTLVARYYKDGKECLIPQEGANPRMLTPRECARLQGYPSTFELPETRTNAYKQFGNSVAVPVVRLIAERIVDRVLRAGV